MSTDILCPDGHPSTLDSVVARGSVYACATCKIKFIVHNAATIAADAKHALAIDARRSGKVPRFKPPIPLQAISKPK